MRLESRLRVALVIAALVLALVPAAAPGNWNPARVELAPTVRLSHGVPASLAHPRHELGDRLAGPAPSR
jgi:hypothetical protein